MQVLVLLAAQPGVVVSRAELLDRVWSGAFVGDDAVSAAVIKLRRAFDDSARHRESSKRFTSPGTA